MENPLQHIKNVFFAGIGGIGMSALARYLHSAGKNITGYDICETELTRELIAEGIQVFYNDNTALIPESFFKTPTLVVRTPAVPDNLEILTIWTQHNTPVVRRSQMLAQIAARHKIYAVAGTHGKTTITTLLSHLLNQRAEQTNSFMGGIAVNYGTNLLISSKSNDMVIEADEYDKAFMLLNPHAAIITSIDADHLDIYHTHENVVKAFNQFVEKIDKNGFLIHKRNLPVIVPTCLKTYTYDVENTGVDIYAKNIYTNSDRTFTFDLVTPNRIYENMHLGVLGYFNLENAVAASAMAIFAGVGENELRQGLSSFKGVKRRFEILNSKTETYIDDYAHHPNEIAACLKSIRGIYPQKHITVIFQPHLYSRTRDFFDEFVTALSKANTVIVTDIYAAREPDLGDINGQQLTLKIHNGIYIPKNEILKYITENKFELLVTMGAGNIGELASDIQTIINNRTTE